MHLDFSGLEQIGKTPPPADTPGAGQEIAPKLQREADNRRSTLNSAADVYKRWQESSKITFMLQAEILKGIRNRENIYTLFLKAAKALSLTIDNNEFYQQIVNELPQYYQDAKTQ